MISEWNLGDTSKGEIGNLVSLREMLRRAMEKNKGHALGLRSVQRTCGMRATLFFDEYEGCAPFESSLAPAPAGYVVEFNIEDNCSSCLERGHCVEYLYWHFIRQKFIDILIEQRKDHEKGRY